MTNIAYQVASIAGEEQFHSMEQISGGCSTKRNAKMSIYPVGIDLGTTQSAVAYIDEHGATQMIRNAEDDVVTPSVVLFDGDQIVVGRDAMRAREFSANRIAEMAKRDMGELRYRHPVDGQYIPPEVIQGCILRKLRSEIVATVGPGHQAVVTVPAYFDEPRRKATADAGRISGLDVLDIVNEPTAAALAFGERLGYLHPTGTSRDTLTLLVYDLGGGTFDVTVIRLTPGEITTLATDGDAELGGCNWDLRLVDHVVQKFTDRFPNAPQPDQASRLRLRQSVEREKYTLSARGKTMIPFEFAGQYFETAVTREDFQLMTADLVERTIFTTRQTLNVAGLLWNDIDRLLLVGGSTRMPMIQEKLGEISSMTPDVNVNPEEAVARGAAIYAQHLLQERGITSVSRSLKVTDVNAHSLGIEGVNKDTLRTENVVLIPRNTSLPNEIHRTFVTRKDDQQSVKIQLLEGESTLPAQCIQLAKAAIRNLPPGLPKGTNIDVCYRFDTNGRLSVRANMSGGGKEVQIELDRVRGLTKHVLDRWRKVVCSDGGFDDFGEAITEMLQQVEEVDDTSPPEAEEKEMPEVKGHSLEPAVPYDAPAASSDALRHEREKQQHRRNEQIHVNHRAKQKPLAAVVFVVGHILASLLGLAIGYYVLCWLNPEIHFFDWHLPGIGTETPGPPPLKKQVEDKPIDLDESPPKKPPEKQVLANKQLTLQQRTELSECLKAVRTALTDRHLQAAHVNLQRATSLANSSKFEQMVDRLHTLHHYVKEFWIAVGEGMLNLHTVGELQVENDEFVSVVEADSETITIHEKGQNKTYKKMELPSHLAIIIAKHWLDEDKPFTKLIEGAFMYVDPDFDNQEAIRVWHTAAGSGEEITDVLKCVEDDYEFVK